jgi:anaerobic nitric oxide reductase flavorubredoxin
MPAVEVKPDIYWIGVNDRTTDLFEGMWPITNTGVSYNAYLIRDEKNVLIDLAKAFKTDEFFDQISEVVAPSQLDYVVINHMEPDHTGVIRMLRKVAPEVTILCSDKAVEMLKDYYGITDNVKAVQDGETLSLGKKTLQFFYTLFVHWPETIMTYETVSQVLFSCDAFGSYGALRGAIFDDECIDPQFYEKESLRYYANIVAKFSTPVLKAIQKLANLQIDVVAPSHGLVWRSHPETIVRLYQKWAEYAKGNNEPCITMIYGSMYGNTEKMMNAVAQGISSTGIDLVIFDAARTHVSFILPSLWIRSGVMIGAPTYEVSLFPPMAQVLEMAVVKRIVNKKAAMFGSFGWSGGAVKKCKSIVEPLKWDWMDTFEFQGGPDKADLKKGEQFGRRFAELVKRSVTS